MTHATLRAAGLLTALAMIAWVAMCAPAPAETFEPIMVDTPVYWTVFGGIALLLGLTIRNFYVMLVAAVVWAILVPAFFTYPAAAHSWYDSDCCSVDDCAPTDDVIQTAEGYYVSEWEIMVPYGDDRLRPSQDGEFHKCGFFMPPMATRDRYEPGSSVSTGWHLYCLYVPVMF